jgi:ribosomal protein L29
MAIIKKDELKKMTAKEAEKKIVEIERALLEAEGEGKRERRKPLRRAIAQLKTVINSKGSATEKAEAAKPKQAVKTEASREGLKTPSP